MEHHLVQGLVNNLRKFCMMKLFAHFFIYATQNFPNIKITSTLSLIDIMPLMDLFKISPDFNQLPIQGVLNTIYKKK